jgi:NAD(P)-dependent dehydrogenase (short-subunit alcohol dehydrogenase family)
MTGRLHGKAALITGAASGIGRASALLFAAEGARIVVCDINADGGGDVAQAVRKTGGDAEFIHADVTDEQDVARAFAAAAERYGPPDVLHNCAGGSTDDDAATGELSIGTLDHVLRVDLRSVVLCSRAAIPLMTAHGGGSIINVSSFVAFRGVFNIHAYISAKGALVSLTRAMAGRYARAGSGSTRSRPASRSASGPRPGWRRATSPHPDLPLRGLPVRRRPARGHRERRAVPGLRRIPHDQRADDRR